MNDFILKELRAAHVLVLDDEKPIRAFVSKMLEAEGHTVAQADCLERARSILATLPIEMVLCDITLRGESGLDLLDELAPRSPDVVVVMMTGNDDTKTAIHCLRSGAFDYLLKPMATSDIVEVIDRVLERQRKMKAERERIEEQLHILGDFPRRIQIRSCGSVTTAPCSMPMTQVPRYSKN